MTRKSYDIILSMLNAEWDNIKGTILYLEHQLGLPQKWRVCQDPEEIMEDNLETLKIKKHEYEQAAHEFEKSYSSIIDPKPTE